MNIQEIKTKKVTLQDVAEKANVSVSTVSRALKKPAAVSNRTRLSILEAANSLGYIKSLSQFQDINAAPVNHKTIALILPNVINPYYPELITLLQKKLAKKNMLISLCVTDNEPKTINRYCRDLMRFGVDGAIIWAMTNYRECSATLERFIEKIPTVAIQSDISGTDTICTSDRDGTAELLEFLVSMGHRKIGFVGYNWDIAVLSERYNAYRDVLAKHGIEYREEYVGLYNTEAESGYDQGCRLLSLTDRPTAIHCANTRVAMGVYSAIRDKHLSIPDDISLSAFDDLEISTLITPPLSVVSLPIDTIINSAITLLEQRINERKSDRAPAILQSIMFPTGLTIRKSIGPAPEAD